MKKFILVCLMAMGSASLAQVSKPAYLDEGKDIEELALFCSSICIKFCLLI